MGQPTGTVDAAAYAAVRVAVVGNPNSGKTTLFNALTGLRQKVGNYPGVTVEKKEGVYAFGGRQYRLSDLPGAYSLTATSEDERIVRDILLGLLKNEPPVDMALVVVDASHLERHLFLASQILDLGLPQVIALTMNDEARRHGRAVDTEYLSDKLGVPVVEVVVPRRRGIDELKLALQGALDQHPAAPPWSIGERVLAAVDELAGQLARYHSGQLPYLRQLAVQLLLYPEREHPLGALPDVRRLADELRGELETGGEPWREAEARGRFQWIKQAVTGARAAAQETYAPSRSDRADRILTHPFWGLLIFACVMAVVFQSIFTWATPFMQGIEWGFSWLGKLVGQLLPAGLLRGLLVDGVIGGVGGVVAFLPQILLLFLFIAILEDSGYMSRAAFLMNRYMRRAGLHGGAFIPLMAGFACSIPAIMAARTIADRRARLATMLVVPLVSCGARLPVYVLLIAAFIPPRPVLPGIRAFNLHGLVLWSIYVLSLAAAMLVALLLRKSIVRGPAQPLILELPPYRLPFWRNVLAAMWSRGRLFLTQAGTIILAMNIVLWFLLAFPSNPPLSGDCAAMRAEASKALAGDELRQRLGELDKLEASERLSQSFGGRLGRVLEPLIKPLGFDWKIGIGIVGSLAAREVFISTLAVVYGVEEADGTGHSLVAKLRNEFGLLTGLSIIIFFILSCQCMATVAVMRREANGWGWALFLYGYMTLLAYLACLVFYQVTSRLWPHLA